MVMSPNMMEMRLVFMFKTDLSHSCFMPAKSNPSPIISHPLANAVSCPQATHGKHSLPIAGATDQLASQMVGPVRCFSRVSALVQ